MKNIPSRFAFLGVALPIILSAAVAFAQDAPQPEYLADVVKQYVVYSTQAWGGLGLNTAVVPPDGRQPTPLRIGDKTYEHGLGHHAPGEILVELDGRYKSFEAEVGVQWQDGQKGSVVFQVFADDEKRFDSGLMTSADAPKPVSVPLDNVQDLRLVVTDGGDGITCDCADWAEARLIPNPNPAPAAPKEFADVAPFARVMAWDPARSEGTKANRVQEFPAEDVFLGTEVLPGADGTYTAPAAANGLTCLGLEWAERRAVRQLRVQFADPAQMPAIEGARAEYWSGESPWQGAWKAIPAQIEQTPGQWAIRVSYVDSPDLRNGAEKIRWIFPATDKPVVVRFLSAITSSSIKTADITLELEAPEPNTEAGVEIYNGFAVNPADASTTKIVPWDLTGPLKVSLKYFNSRPWKTDRTVLRVQLPKASFGVAVDDILANGCVYVPHAGFFATTGISLADYKATIAPQKTVLARVNEMPDQTFAQAFEKVHNPIQNNGPMMLSLACDNRKFVTHQNGDVTFEIYDTPDQDVGWPDTYSCKLASVFGSGKPNLVTRHLEGDWLPVPVTSVGDSGISYQQRTFVAPCDDAPIANTADWLYQHAVCVVDYTLENAQLNPVDALLKLTFSAKNPVAIQPIDGGFTVVVDGRVLGVVNTAELAPLAAATDAGTVTINGSLPAGAKAHCVVYLPAWKVAPEQAATVKGDWLPKCNAYWQKTLANSAQIDVPEPLLNNIIRASQVHCLLAARNEEMGKRISAFIASDRYGPLESEAHAVIRGMDFMGHGAYAQRSLDFFIHRYNPAGFLTTGYTLMGTGWHLWTLAEHVERAGDEQWMKTVAPDVARACQWIAAQCEKTKKNSADGGKEPEFGLVPAGVAADWNRFAYRFAVEAHYWAGLRQAAGALAATGHPDAPALIEKANVFRDEILRAYRWTQAKTPVVQLQDGAWIPAYPGMLGCFGRIEDIIPGEDGNRSWAYDVELGAHHLAALGVFDPQAPEVSWIMNHMEDFWFLHSGMGDYPAEKNQADFFNLGGFSKVQPYYTRNAEIYALRDDVKPFIRSYFNTFPSLLSLENLSFWEHFHNTGAWNKTHETGYFLAQTRLMLAMERGDQLWLAPLVTSNWLKDGMKIAVHNMPTRFGSLTYTITSVVGGGYIEATIEPLARKTPSAIMLRLRHPEGKPIQSVTVNGQPHTAFDAANNTITLVPAANPVSVRVQY